MTVKRQVKIIIFALLSAVLVALLSAFFGCGNDDTEPKMNIDYRTGADGNSYTVQNGEAQEFFDVSEGEAVSVDVTVKRDSGDLYIKIYCVDDPERVIYEGHDLPMEHFTVTVRESGSYRIAIRAEDFVGSYRFGYSTVK